MVPGWFNCAKGMGLDVMVELVLLSAQLKYSYFVDTHAKVEGVHAELAAILRALQPLDTASDRRKDIDVQMKRQIEAVEDLFDGVAATASRTFASKEANLTVALILRMLKRCRVTV